MHRTNYLTGVGILAGRVALMAMNGEGRIARSCVGRILKLAIGEEWRVIKLLQVVFEVRQADED